MLELKNISFYYKKSEKILNSISLSVKPKQFMGILGPNGGGKSTLLKIIVGLLQPVEGEIYFYGQRVKRFKDFPLHKLSYVPQGDILECALPLRIVDVVNFGCPFTNKSHRPPMSVDQALSIVGLKKHKEALIHNISGGERQRALLAKALMKYPELLVLDEPTKGLDVKGQEQLFDVIKIIQSESQTAIVLVDHRVSKVITYCDHLFCLDKGSHWTI